MPRRKPYHSHTAPPKIVKRLAIEYDCMSGDLGLVENDFGAVEAFGVLEAVKAMIAKRWLE